jgi:effector-binding domain-containing protein
MIGEPQIIKRPAQPYVARRTQVTMQELGSVIPQLLAAVYAWLREHGIAPTGAPFIRYRVIDMRAKLDIELGVPIGQMVGSDDPLVADALPAGRYATLIYTDVARGIEANKALLDWGAQQGLVWDSWPEGSGEGFGARVEFYLTDPQDEPDLAKWETEVAIRLADDPARP